MNTVEAVFCMGLPSGLIITSNLLVAYRLKQQLRETPSAPSVSFGTSDIILASYNAPTSPRLSTFMKKSSLAYLSNRLSIGLISTDSKKKKRIRYTELQLTRSLMVVTWTFIALNLPNYLYRIIINVMEIDPGSLTMQYVGLLVHTALYTHHALLFYLYIFYSPQMKKRLWPTLLKMLECYCVQTTI
ncbi:hypothetical protein AB6A40_000862 [Gnathostoma spinigerum]|uniref:G-protein coupled receptors family 1 profile domain-containing protein n=1 Tax=Gnathostoma spinigerum TaxID=75299 RepID=A0ABD6E2X1_9BILA